MNTQSPNTKESTSSIVERLEKVANEQSWFYRKFVRDHCTSCGIDLREGAFVLSPGMNYPICPHCAAKEFEQKK